MGLFGRRTDTHAAAQPEELAELRRSNAQQQATPSLIGCVEQLLKSEQIETLHAGTFMLRGAQGKIVITCHYVTNGHPLHISTLGFQEIVQYLEGRGYYLTFSARWSSTELDSLGEALLPSDRAGYYHTVRDYEQDFNSVQDLEKWARCPAAKTADDATIFMIIKKTFA